MKPSDILLAAPLFWTAVQSSAVPLYHWQLIANNPDIDEATRANANFTYHHSLMLLERRHQAIIAGKAAPPYGGGDAGQPFLDDTPFDYEQDPIHAADLAEELAAMQNAQVNQPVQPYVMEGGGAPGEGTVSGNGTRSARRRRSVQEMMRDHQERVAANMKRQFPTTYLGVWENDQSCGVAPPRHKVRETGSPLAADPGVNQLFVNQINTLNLLNIIFDRNSIDNAGKPFYGVVHYCANYNNLFWDGVQAVLGDNDGYAYVKNSYPGSTSFVAHEYGHGVVEFTNPLYYSGMSGALNEHLADVIGVLTEQFAFGQNANQASWLVGAGTVVNSNGGNALPSRTFINPGTAYNTAALGPDRQVGNMLNYYYGSDDNFGVHFNSGIPNRAFYLFCTALGGDAYSGCGRVWYDTLLGNSGRFDYTGETFTMFASKTVQSAGRIGGTQMADTLQSAWNQVGIYPFSFIAPFSPIGTKE